MARDASDDVESSSAPPSRQADATAPPIAISEVPDACRAANKIRVELVGGLTANTTLTCDKEYRLRGLVLVKAGVTLTIEKGTTIVGQNDVNEPALLVLQPGAKISAAGTAADPIVFTSAMPPDLRRPGDWGGVIVLGRAPAQGTQPDAGTSAPHVPGLAIGGAYGGTDANDDSGVLQYVRVEYGGVALAPGVKASGVTFAGVGRGTIVDFLEVRQSTGDCFSAFGGTVNAKHLICHRSGGNGFSWHNGYVGKLQFIAVQQDPKAAEEANGLSGENNESNSTRAPLSEPTIYNATLCGKNVQVPQQQYGILVRRGSRAHIFNTIVTGFEAGLDFRDTVVGVEVKNSVFFGNIAKNLAYEEDASNLDTQRDDDFGFNETTWLTTSTFKNITINPGTACFDGTAPRFQPTSTILLNAAAPPADGFFDASARFVGAFRDAADAWAAGAWVSWSDH